MESDFNTHKGFRLINIYERLNKGEVLSKAKLARDYNVTEKTVQRDIDDLRAYIAEFHYTEADTAIKYSRAKGGYYLVRFEREWLTCEEVLAMCKILLESRALKKDELVQLIGKLLAQAAPSDRTSVDLIIKNELHHYIPLKHNKSLLSPIWELSQFILKNEMINFAYTRKDGVDKQHTVKPVAIMFSEYCFYLIAFMADDSKKFPTVFRIDRIENIKGTGEKFAIPYRDKFNDGEFRKRVQFMFSGELRRVNFEYSGPSIESVLDRLPTAKILSEKDGTYTITAEVYGDGIDMWLRSQGDRVHIIT